MGLRSDRVTVNSVMEGDITYKDKNSELSTMGVAAGL